MRPESKFWSVLQLLVSLTESEASVSNVICSHGWLVSGSYRWKASAPSYVAFSQGLLEGLHLIEIDFPLSDWFKRMQKLQHLYWSLNSQPFIFLSYLFYRAVNFTWWERTDYTGHKYQEARLNGVSFGVLLPHLVNPTFVNSSLKYFFKSEIFQKELHHNSVSDFFNNCIFFIRKSLFRRVFWMAVWQCFIVDLLECNSSQNLFYLTMKRQMDWEKLLKPDIEQSNIIGLSLKKF